ncbi:MAG: molybdate ABC transporter substrate-binding protein [Clostridiales Family XIII bacterium]|jgi:molybdate transport system substrate-binding protein|nr:molybdate ABC transporter substrate-binding protein [Clostridiales Family XIII bacterium]
MKLKGRRSLLLILAILLVLTAAMFGACAKDGSEDTPAGEEPPVTEEPVVTGSVMIAAAASLENALTEELIPLFNADFPDVAVTGTYDSSGKLQEQIEGGLDAAVFFSAATKQMNALVEAGFIDASEVVNLLENEIVLIASANSDTKIASFEEIGDAASVAIGDPASVPAGQYAEEVLTSIGVWDAISAKASLGTNVTEVLNWVAEGSAEVGIVYATDAASMPDNVKVLAIAPAESLQTPVIYPVATLKGVSDENKEAAAKFVEFLQSDAAMSVFEKYGFKAAA